MLMTVMAALALQTASPQAAEAAPAPATAAQPRNSRRQGNDRMVCENRAPTGSVTRRNMCRTERRAQADARTAQDYLANVTRGTANEPMPLGGSGPATP